MPIHSIISEDDIFAQAEMNPDMNIIRLNKEAFPHRDSLFSTAPAEYLKYLTECVNKDIMPPKTRR